jgi:hypothetical protein
LLTCGDTFLIPKRGTDTEHLWIVITEPDADANAVCVSVTTKRSYSDTTVVLSVGDHPFVKHESVIHYADARILDLRTVEAALDANTRSFVCVSHKPCSDSLLARVQDGLLKSPYPTKGIKAVFRAARGIRD